MENKIKINWQEYSNGDLLQKNFEEQIWKLNEKSFLTPIDIPNLKLIFFQFDKIFGILEELTKFNKDSKNKILDEEIKSRECAILQIDKILNGDGEENFNAKTISAINAMRNYKDEICHLKEMKKYKHLSITHHGKVDQNPIDTFLQSAFKSADAILKSCSLNSFAKEKFRNIANLALNDSSLLHEISKMVGTSNEFGKQTKFNLGKN